MSISTMTSTAYRRRVRRAASASGSTDHLAEPVPTSVADEDETAQTAVSSALATVTTYIPTEILVLYVAWIAALGDSRATAGGVPSSIAGGWPSFWAFLLATPAVVWLVYAGRVRAAGDPLPVPIGLWPHWEMTAATCAFVAWAAALPATPFTQFGWYNSGIAGVIVLAVTAFLGLVAPIATAPPARASAVRHVGRATLPAAEPVPATGAALSAPIVDAEPPLVGVGPGIASEEPAR